MNENKQIMRQIVCAVIYLAKQGVPFRGDVEDVNLNENPGNFLALLKDHAETDPILHKHLYTPKARMQLTVLLGLKMKSLMSLDMTIFSQI